MTTPPTPSHRLARDGRPHLALVTDQEHPAASGSEEQQGPMNAAPRRIPAAGSATVRALMALGALLSAFGMSSGKADASLRAHEIPKEEADPGDEYTPAAPVLTTSSTPPSSAGHWAPTTHRAELAAYTVPTSAPTGKHRGSVAVEGWGEWNPDQWDRPTGRHRGSPGARHGHNRPLVARQPVASTPHVKAVELSVKVPALPPVIAALKRN